MKKLLLICFLFVSTLIKAQFGAFSVNEVANMPMATSNNAVTEGWANDTAYVYSFGGIDSSKIWSGIHKKAFRYNAVTDIWDTIPDLPNTNAVIAAGASYVDSIIYIMGGYRVLSNGSEISTNIVNRFDPRTNTYLSDGTNIPVAIDDHVQVVYRDSLIYLITGWSNSGNVPNVQIYDPINDNWLTGTPVPSNNTYKAFGASGAIVGNTIYYHGGASTGTNFPIQSTLRIGQIDTNDPTQITWTYKSTNFSRYRSACISLDVTGLIHFIGGATKSYNYNGIAYDGSGGIQPTNNSVCYQPSFDTTYSFQNWNTIPMDLRGFAYSWHSNIGIGFIAGGMTSNQTVSNKTFNIDYIITNTKNEKREINSFKLYPNPTSEQVNLVFKAKEERTIRLINLLGKEVYKTESNKVNHQLDVSNYPKGIYFVKVETNENSSSQKIIIQ